MARFPAREPHRGTRAASICRPAVPCSRDATSTSSACPASTQVRRIEGASLRFTTSRRLFEKRLVAEEAHALLDGEVLAVQANGDHEAGEAHECFGELSEPIVTSPRRKPASTIMCSQ